MLGRAIDAELAIISGPAAMGPLISPDADASEIHTGNGNSNVDSGNIGSSNGQWHVVDRAQWGSTFTLNKMKLAIDPSTGAIISLQTDARHSAAASNHSRAEQATTHPQATRDWASSSHPIARFAYVAHDAAQAEAFFGNYSFGCPRCGWAKEAFTKPGKCLSTQLCTLQRSAYISKRYCRCDTNACKRFNYIWHYGGSLGEDSIIWLGRWRE
jgi:hypothetical protein